MLLYYSLKGIYGVYRLSLKSKILIGNHLAQLVRAQTYALSVFYVMGVAKSRELKTLE